MERDAIIDTFRELASEIAEKDFAHVNEDTTIVDLGIDSLGMLELVGAIERELGAEIPTESLAGVTTVRQLIDKVEESLGATGQEATGSASPEKSRTQAS